MYDIEEKIEIYLVASNTYLMDNNFKVALKYATIAIDLIENQLSIISRLHYRRGIREDYIIRINQIILSCIESATIEEIIDLLVFSKLNSFSDWLSVLDWYKEIKNGSSVISEVKEDIGNKIEGLISFGTPILYGFREKYDDPFEDIENPGIPLFESTNYSNMWREFNFSMTKIINTIKYKQPYKYSSVNYVRDEVLLGLKENKSYIFVYVNNGFIIFINLTKNQVNVAKTDMRNYIKYIRLLDMYRFKEATFREFTDELQNYIDILSKNLNTMINHIVNIAPNEVIIIPDKLVYTVPIVPVLLEHDDFRQKIKQGEIKIKYCSVLYKSKEKVTKIKHGIGLITSADDLPLLDEEMLIPMKYLDIQSWKISNLSDGKLNYKDEEVKNTDVIHMV